MFKPFPIKLKTMTESNTITKISSLPPVKLKGLKKADLKAYFENTWSIYEQLFSANKSEKTYYLSPDPLRNPLIFYWGHTAAFYINKMVLAGLLEKGLNPRFEQLFAVGVDPDLPENLEVLDLWPPLEEVHNYRNQVYKTVLDVIENIPIDEVITETSPWWAVLMGLEHDRIHFETSSVLIRQLPVDLLERPEGWEYAPTFGKTDKNKVIQVKGGEVNLGKSKTDNLYGWDNEYGHLQVSVAPFEATQNLITNAEYLDFFECGAYNDSRFWTSEGWEWKNRVQAEHPKFWVKNENSFSYRAMFDEIPMPLDWPVEVNAHEAWAYCNWKGESWRLLSEAEFNLILKENLKHNLQPVFTENYNLNMAFGSPTPVGYMKHHQSAYDFNDLFGNVWDWLKDDFYPFPGFESHPWYEDFSEPFFDEDHSMLLGGAWATTGTGASRYYRLWFRRHFFQHAGFRMARSL